MTFTDEQRKALSAPLNRAHVKERKQAGRLVSYIEAWHALAEANRIFGFDGWSRETVDLREVCAAPTKIGQDKRDGWRVGYIAKVRIEAGSIYRDGTGFGSGIDVDLGAAHESAVKEAESDATKRALMTFGFPFGLALYDKTQEHVEDAPRTPPQPAVQPAVPPTPKPPHNPETGEIMGPHAISKSGVNWLQWGSMFIAAVRTAQTHAEVENWQTWNSTTLAAMSAESPKAYASVQRAINVQTAQIGPELMVADELHRVLSEK